MAKVAIYPGSFDPLTNGHLDVIERAAALVDQVVVAIGVNAGKKPLLPEEVRKSSIEASVSHLPNVSVDIFDGLMVEFARSRGAGVIVRGLRATSDFDYEFQIAMANRRLAPGLESIFLMTKWDHSFLSSTVVREIALLGGDYSSFVPKPVFEAVAEYLGRHS